MKKRDKNMTMVGFRLPEESHTQLKMAMASNKLTMQKMVADIIFNYLTHSAQNKPVAKNRKAKES